MEKCNISNKKYIKNKINIIIVFKEQFQQLPCKHDPLTFSASSFFKLCLITRGISKIPCGILIFECNPCFIPVFFAKNSSTG